MSYFNEICNKTLIRLIDNSNMIIRNELIRKKNVGIFIAEK